LSITGWNPLTAAVDRGLVAEYEVDFFWPDAGLAVEFDGAATHHTRRAFHRDRQRDRDLASQGIQVVRVTSRDLRGDSAALARELAAILARRHRER